MIDYNSFHSYKIDEQISFCQTVLEILKNHDPEALMVKELIDHLTAALEAAKLVAEGNRGSALTSGLQVREHNRDEALVGYRNHIDAGTHRINPEWVEHSELLVHLYRTMGWGFHRESNVAQTSRIAEMDKILNSDRKYVAALNATQSTDWWTDVITANAEYLELEARRSNEYANDADNATAYKELREAYQKLVDLPSLLEKMLTAFFNISLSIWASLSSFFRRIISFCSDVKLAFPFPEKLPSPCCSNSRFQRRTISGRIFNSSAT